MPICRMPKRGLPISLARILITPIVLTQSLDSCLNSMLGSAGGGDVITGLESRYYHYNATEIKQRVDILVDTIFVLKKEYKFFDINVGEDVDKESLYSAITRKDKDYLSKFLFDRVIKLQKSRFF